MNRIQFLMLIAFTALFFVCCSSEENKKEDTSGKTNETKELKITVTLPQGWNPVEGSVLEHQYMKNSASFMIKEETMLNNKTLTVAVDEATDNISSYFDNVTIIETTSLLIDGYDAKSVLFTYSVTVGSNPINMKMQSVYVMVNNTCQNISFGDMAGTFDSITDDITQILQGIKFEL